MSISRSIHLWRILKQDKMTEQKLTEILRVLWAKRFFNSKKKLSEIKDELSRLGCNPSDANLCMALKNAKYLTRKGIKRKYTYIQKTASKEIVLDHDLFSDSLINSMGEDFKEEIKDLHLNYGQSGTCTSFLLRKILEKLIFLGFAKNSLSDKLKDSRGDFLGLKAMLNMASSTKIGGKTFLMPKTAKSIEGIKFLGDTSAHNPLTNVSIRTIIPQMPFIITAYEELSKNL